jgi:hypothetical protein
MSLTAATCNNWTAPGAVVPVEALKLPEVDAGVTEAAGTDDPTVAGSVVATVLGG